MASSWSTFSISIPANPCASARYSGYFVADACNSAYVLGVNRLVELFLALGREEAGFCRRTRCSR